MNFTADFIMDFTADFMLDFTANFMLIPPYFIIDFMTNFIISTRISLKLTRFHEIHNISQDFIMDLTENSIPVKSVMKFIMKSANEIHGEIHHKPKAHNEKLMLFMKSGVFHFSCVFHVLLTLHVFFTF